MKLLAVATLNHRLTQAKLAPLLGAGWVDEVRWVTRQPGPPLPRVRYVPVPEGRTWQRTTALLTTVLRVAREQRPHMIMAYNVVPFGLVAYAASRLLGIPLAIHVIGGPLEIEGGGYQTENRVLSRFDRPSRTMERLILHVLAVADLVTTTGSRTRQYLMRRGIAPEKITPISSVVDPTFFRPVVRAPLYDLVCVSALIPRKRLEWLIDLAADAVSWRRDLRVAVVGTGPLRDLLERRIEQRGLQGTVALLGFQPDVREILWASRLFVMTSFREGLPLSLIEAMACGLASLVGDFGDVTDLVRDGVNGRVLPLAEYGVYREALRELLTDESARRRYAGAAVASVAAGYTVDHAVRKWNAVYEERLSRLGS